MAFRMLQVNATDAKVRLAELLRITRNGERISITRHGRVIAHLVPAQQEEIAHRQAALASFERRRERWQGGAHHEGNPELAARRTSTLSAFVLDVLRGRILGVAGRGLDGRQCGPPSSRYGRCSRAATVAP
ncbi:MAG: type II toxin-antitoxin system prevent-host-death family antitoxin [Gammaproteobacteria bacterium]|nr:type II toxin-antitoxin system prevent-host-death family antitoxin [Gammaproteobacteria bacterium]